MISSTDFNIAMQFNAEKMLKRAIEFDWSVVMAAIKKLVEAPWPLCLLL